MKVPFTGVTWLPADDTRTASPQVPESAAGSVPTTLPGTGCVIASAGGVLSTVKRTLRVARFPARSTETAASWCVPSAETGAPETNCAPSSVTTVVPGCASTTETTGAAARPKRRPSARTSPDSTSFDRRRDRVEDDRRTGRPDAALQIAPGGNEDFRSFDERHAAREEAAARQGRRDAVDVDRHGRPGGTGHVDRARAEDRSRRRRDDGDARSLASARDDTERDRRLRVAAKRVAQPCEKSVLPLRGDEVTGPEGRAVQEKRHLGDGDARKGRRLGTDGAVEESSVREGRTRFHEGGREGRTVLHETRHARLPVETNRRRSQRPGQGRVAPENGGGPRGEDEGPQRRGSLERQLRARRPQAEEQAVPTRGSGGSGRRDGSAR